MSMRPTDPETARKTCRHFRVKRDYYENDAPPGPEHERSPEYPWCDGTAMPVGPDDGPVLREMCGPERSCFVPVLGPEA